MAKNTTKKTVRAPATRKSTASSASPTKPEAALPAPPPGFLPLKSEPDPDAVNGACPKCGTPQPECDAAYVMCPKCKTIYKRALQL
jgi:hypothetical protein